MLLDVRVEVLGAAVVREGQLVVTGRALGGRRAQVVLTALALANGQVIAERLARALWPDELPPTWRAAVRGAVRELRQACAGVGGDQQLIETVPSGYRLGTGVEVDVRIAELTVRQARGLSQQGRHRAALDLAEPASRLSGDDLLPAEPAGWLDEYRHAVTALALDAARVTVEAAGALGEHHRALDAAHRARARHPLDERAHRLVITAFDQAGDRAGAVQAFETCRAVLAEQLGVDPSDETVGAYLHSLSDRPGRVAVAPVPVVASSFIGRTRELAELSAAVARPGLVTVVGRGGAGKSRLAAQVADAARDRFAAGRFWVPVASMTPEALVPADVALALGLAAGSAEPTEAIAEHLAPLGRALLVFDGCETVVDGVATLVAALLQRAPLLTVLTTSRRALDVDPERLVVLEPWPAPTDEAELSSSEPFRLLTDRIREAGCDEPGPAAAPLLIALCRRAAGLPLALELIAAQLTAMSAGDLVDHLETLSMSHEDPLRSITNSSYALLTRDEAAVFRRLGVFDGPVDLALIRRVVAGEPVEALRVVRILRELAARGLVAVDRTGPRWLYRHDDDLHRFAREQLRATGEEHGAYRALASAIRSMLPEDARADPTPFRAELAGLIGSLRSLFAAALGGHADADDSQEIAFRLHRVFATTNVHEGRLWLAALLDVRPDGAWAPYVAYALGYLSYWAGLTVDATHYLRRAVRLLEPRPDAYRARALIFLAGLLDDDDRGAEAVECVRESIAAAAPFDVDLRCSAAMGMGSVLAERVDPAAVRYADAAIELCRADGSEQQLAITLPTAAMVCWQVGDLDAARRHLAAALLLDAGRPRIARTVMLSAAAGVALADGRLDAAEEYGRIADHEATELGVDREMPLVRAVLARTLLERGDVPAAAQGCAAALEAALTMTVDFPLAVGLETAALVLDAADGRQRGELPASVAELLAAADVLRTRGDRPAPVPLAAAVSTLRARSTSLDPPPDEPRVVARRALGLLAGVAAAQPVAAPTSSRNSNR